MTKLVHLGLVVLTGLLEAFTTWLQKKEQKNLEKHMADVRADPATHWLRRFGGTDKRTTPPNPADSGGRDNG